MPEPASCSVMGVTEHPFSQRIGAPGVRLSASLLSSCVFLSLCREGGPPIAALPWPAGRRAIAASSHARSCSHDKPARWSCPTAAVLAASACRPIDLAPDRFLRRRASPSAESRRPRVERPRSRQATTAWSTHRRPPQAPWSIIARRNHRSAERLRHAPVRRSQRFWSKVAAGSVVTKAVPPHTTVAGVPAHPVGRPASEIPAYDMNQELDENEG